MADSPDTPTAVAEAPPSDDTARYAPLLGTDERVLVVRRRHWFSLAEGARWFFLAVGIAIVIEVINGIVPNGKLTNWLSTAFDWGFGLFLVVGLAGVGWYYLVWQRERYLVTTRRVIAAGGVKTILDAKYQHELEVGGGRAAVAPPAGAAPAPRERMTAQEVDDSITRLAAMRDRGVITAAEFEEKKRELLDRL